MKKSLTVVGILALLFATWPAAPAQTKSTRFDPSGAYWISGEPPADFSDFSAINVNMRQLRRLPTSGMELNDGTRLRFKTVVVKQSSLNRAQNSPKKQTLLVLLSCTRKV